MRLIGLLCLLLLGFFVPAGAALLPAGTPLTARFVAAPVSAALEVTGAGDQFHIIVDRPSLPLGNAATLAIEVTLEELQYDPTAGRFHGALIGTFEGRERFRLPIFGRARPVIRMPARSRPVAPHGLIRAADLTWVQVAQAHMPSASLTEPGPIVGSQARRRLAPGRVLSARDLGPPHLVRRGHPVELIYARPGLRVTALGVAQEDGALGAPVRVMNAASRRQLQGVVSGPDEVSVGATGPLPTR